MDNAQIADAFDELADLLEIKGENPFRIRAYRNGAVAIRELPEPVADLLNDPSRDLADIPGVGKTLAEKSRLLVETGKLPQLEELRAEIPSSVLAMVRIPGIGAKKAGALHRELGVETLEELRAACLAGQVRALKGFAAKTEQMILEGLSLAAQAGERIYWASAEPLVDRLRDYMQRSPAAERIEPAGSFRRGRETVGDLDMLVVSTEPGAVMDHLQAYPGRQETLLRGEEKKMSIRLQEGMQVDLRVVSKESFGAALQYFTGSQAHNIRLRHRAKRMGLKVNEYGVFREADDSRVAGETEEGVYAALGLPWIDPALREDREEFQWAEQGALPKLVTTDQIRGDLHMHTTASDGHGSIEEMAEAAIARGLWYIAITDHSRRVTMAGGLDPHRLRTQWRAIDALRPKFEGRLTILKGVECDILERGGMDLPDEVLSEADWVLASIHYGQKQSRQQITDRLLGAIENPHVTCVAHPTGRLINRRAAYDVDMPAVMQAASETGTLLELNANPARLDLNDLHLAEARRREIPVVINSDAHSVEGLDVMRYGVLQARRGGLSAEQVANTRPWPAMQRLLGRHR